MKRLTRCALSLVVCLICMTSSAEVVNMRAPTNPQAFSQEITTSAVISPVLFNQHGGAYGVWVDTTNGVVDITLAAGAEDGSELTILITQGNSPVVVYAAGSETVNQDNKHYWIEATGKTILKKQCPPQQKNRRHSAMNTLLI